MKKTIKVIKDYYICDRCGKKYSKQEGEVKLSTVRFKWLKLFYHWTGIIWPKEYTKSYDLCEDCTEEFKKFMKITKEGEEKIHGVCI